MNKILIIDDDVEFSALAKEFLTPEGFSVDSSSDGEDGLKKIASQKYSLVILDVMMPNMSGFQVLSSIHKISDVPVLMLTAKNDVTDRIVGLEMGADDYIYKPFNPRELIARIRSIIRRARLEKEGVASGLSAKVTVGDLELDKEARSVRCGGVLVDLTSVEFTILEVLLRSAGTVVSKEEIAKNSLGRPLAPFDRSIDVHISHLRKKLGKSRDGLERIKTVRSEGYQYLLNSAAQAELA